MKFSLVFVLCILHFSLLSQDKTFVVDSIMDAYMRSGYADKHFMGKGKFDKYDKKTGKWKDYEVDYENVFLANDNEMPFIRIGTYLIYGKGEYLRGKRIGEWKHYVLVDKSFKKIHFKTSTYINGEQDGEATYYFQSGEVAGKVSFKGDFFNGKFTQYYPNGDVSATTIFKDSKRVGAQFRYGVNGNLSSKQIFVDDSLHGEQIYYYNDGKVQWSSEYKMGVEHGTYKYFREDGSIWTEKESENGLVMNVRTYSETGELMDNGTLKDGNGTVKYFKRTGEVYLIETYENGAVISEDRSGEFDW